MKRLIFPIVFFLVGFFSTTVQIILIRELFVIFYGNEIVLSLIFFFWFFSIGVGAYAASLLKNLLGSLSFFIIIVAILLVVPELQIFLTREMRIIGGINPGEWVPLSKIFVYTGLIVFPFSFLIGLIFPCASSLSLKFSQKLDENPKKSAGFVYSVESLGSMLGGILSSIILIKYLSHVEIIFLPVLLTSAVVILLSIYFHTTNTQKIISITALLILTTISILIAPKLNNDGLDFRWRGIASETKTEEINSVYQNISIGKSEEQYNLYGNGSYISSFPDPFRSEGLSHLFLSLHGAPKEILFSAEGMEEMIQYFLKHNPDKIDLIEIDSKIHSEIIKYLPKDSIEALNDKRVSIKFEDSRKYIRNLSKNGAKKFDMVISLPPDPTTLNLNRFFTLEFFNDVKNILKDDGVFITQVSSTENYLSGNIGKYLGSVYKTLKSVFPNIFVIPGTISYLVCSPSTQNLTYDLKEVEKRFSSRNIETKYFNVNNFSVFLEKWRIERVKGTLEKNLNTYQTNLDFTPSTFLLSLKILSEYSGKFSNKLLDFFTKINFFYYVFILIILLISRIIYTRIVRKSRTEITKFNSLFSIGTTGFIGFALQLIIIYFYQSQFGYIYQNLGILVGFFMLGLFAGSLFGNKVIEKIKVGSTKAILLTEIAIGTFTILLPFIFKSFPCESIVFLASLISGFLTGFEFPIANKIYFEETNLVKSAAFIDSLDHIGAALGAILCGIVLIPNIGIIETCLLLFSIKIVSLLLWLTKKCNYSLKGSTGSEI